MSFVKTEKIAISKDNSYEVLRVIAILMVLLNHRYPYAVAEIDSPATLNYYIKCVISVIIKCGSPLFFMISGALLLGKSESFKRIFLHRILRILIIMLLCTLLVMIQDKNYSRPDIIFSTGLNWYLYSYVAYLFMLPLLRIIAQHITKEQMKIYIYLTTLFYSGYGVLIFLRYSCKILDNMMFYTTNWASFCWNMIFPLSGWMICKLEEDSNTDNNILNIFLSCGTAISLLIGVALFSIEVHHFQGENVEMMRQHFIYLPTLFIFQMCYRFFHHHNISSNVLSKLISIISNSTFGIFILETHTSISRHINTFLLSHISWGQYEVECLSVLVELMVFTTITVIIKSVIPPLRKLL
ncbi:acyltransferase family protein [Butyrivibrio sp. TB]|uniref:acyltransferase family protein n=1 Tax=Butyrivibrio sp. TB TaxID=1520809 RepID=UPI0008B50CF1|nr:acyltransferase family protein [Butyrivibrio sp. TB]SEP95154.1 Acyltransferase family protein [Butyrivibrio sp. TB]